VDDLAAGNGFANPRAEGGFVYLTATGTSPGESSPGRARMLVRVAETGGAVEAVARGVRDTVFDVHGGVLYWLDADRPALLALPVGARGAAPRVLADDEALAHVSAIAADEDGVFVATGYGGSGRVLGL